MPKKRILQDRGVVRVTFELPADVKGQTAHLVGDFTSWKGVPMERRKEGGWHTSVDLEPGRSYEFRYMIDGARWENDWAADRYVRNPFGHENSVVETPPLPSDSADAGSAGPATKTATKKAATKKTATRSPAKKAAAKKSPAKKAAAKKTATKKAPATKAAPKTSTAKKSAARKPATRNPAPGTSATEQGGAKRPEGDSRGT